MKWRGNRQGLVIKEEDAGVSSCLGDPEFSPAASSANSECLQWVLDLFPPFHLLKDPQFSPDMKVSHFLWELLCFVQDVVSEPM